MEAEGVLAADDADAPGSDGIEGVLPHIEGAPEGGFLAPQRRLDVALSLYQFGIGVTHQLHDPCHRARQGSLDAEPALAVEGGAPDHTPEYVSPALVARADTVGDEEGGAAGVIREQT